eukprot:Selendium_serpulae@DN6385_c0_g1_i2.p3
MASEGGSQENEWGAQNQDGEETSEGRERPRSAAAKAEPKAAAANSAYTLARAELAKAVREHKEVEAQLKTVREEEKRVLTEYDKTEADLKALQSVGQIVGEVLRQLDSEKFIVKASSGPRYVVGCKVKIDKSTLTSGCRVALVSEPLKQDLRKVAVFVVPRT